MHQAAVRLTLAVAFLSCLVRNVHAFLLPTLPVQRHSTALFMKASSSPLSTRRSSLASRTDLLNKASFGLAAAATAFFITPSLLPSSSSSWSANAAPTGEIEDLAPPTAAEIEAERVKSKLKRQAETVIQENAAKGGGGGEKKDYGESLKREREKQKLLKKDAAQRRQDLCENLGRGC